MPPDGHLSAPDHSLPIFRAPITRERPVPGKLWPRTRGPDSGLFPWFPDYFLSDRVQRRPPATDNIVSANKRYLVFIIVYWILKMPGDKEATIIADPR